MPNSFGAVGCFLFSGTYLYRSPRNPTKNGSDLPQCRQRIWQAPEVVPEQTRWGGRCRIERWAPFRTTVQSVRLNKKNLPADFFLSFAAGIVGLLIFLLACFLDGFDNLPDCSSRVTGLTLFFCEPVATSTCGNGLHDVRETVGSEATFMSGLSCSLHLASSSSSYVAGP